MPDPGSHHFDIKRTRLRGELERDETPSVPDQHADRQAREELELAQHRLASGTLVGRYAR